MNKKRNKEVGAGNYLVEVIVEKKNSSADTVIMSKIKNLKPIQLLTPNSITT